MECNEHLVACSLRCLSSLLFSCLAVHLAKHTEIFLEGFGAAVVSSGVHHQDIVNGLTLENLNWRFFHGLYLSKRRGFSEVNFPFKFWD